VEINITSCPGSESLWEPLRLRNDRRGISHEAGIVKVILLWEFFQRDSVGLNLIETHYLTKIILEAIISTFLKRIRM